jgi:D-alanyl-D-alanine carboxypeptidase
MSRFDTFLATVLESATREARADGSSTVEAHHLLLAIADSGEPSTRQVLGPIGLDREAIQAALTHEYARSLNAGGVSIDPSDFPRPSHPRAESPSMGASVKLALERGFGSVARKRDLRPAHLLLGIVQAPVGTVPRALDLAGVDRIALDERLRQHLEQ